MRFRGVTLLTLCYRTAPDAIDRLLPPPLESTGDVVMIHLYQMADVDFLGPVNECNVMVGARMDAAAGAVEGGYTTAQFLDSDAGLAHGREVHGQPKKFADVAIETRGDLSVGTVTRNGIDIITATLPYKQRQADPAMMRRHFDFSENLNLKLIPHIDGRPAVQQLTARKLTDVETTECWTGPCTVELRPNAQAPVWRLPVVEPLEGFLWSTSFTLVEGRVVHDYLTEETP
jgi:acetoacetate decarboxylase